MTKVLRIALPLFTACACATTPQEPTETSPSAWAAAPKPLPTTLDEAAASRFRTPENRARDRYRNPIGTLTFFGIKPTMTVVEISPGAGWYAEILAPSLALQGTYVAAIAPHGGNEALKAIGDKFETWISSHPELEGKITKATFSPSESADIVPEGSADLVLTFRNVHNWMSKGVAQAAFDSFFKALKPGGILGVVEHRENPRAKIDAEAKNGYVHESEVIRMARKAGFRLAAKSEINANPKDTKDHPQGVWTLPPSLRLGDQDKEKYVAIGESDRMTLKFVKPAQAATSGRK